MQKEMEFPTEWAIPSAMEGNPPGDRKPPKFRAGDTAAAPSEETVTLAPETFLRGAYT
jgi:hypothetical protein